jgi:hypothetical protein
MQTLHANRSLAKARSSAGDSPFPEASIAASEPFGKARDTQSSAARQQNAQLQLALATSALASGMAGLLLDVFTEAAAAAGSSTRPSSRSLWTIAAQSVRDGGAITPESRHWLPNRGSVLEAELGAVGNTPAVVTEHQSPARKHGAKNAGAGGCRGGGHVLQGEGAGFGNTPHVATDRLPQEASQGSSLSITVPYRPSAGSAASLYTPKLSLVTTEYRAPSAASVSSSGAAQGPIAAGRQLPLQATVNGSGAKAVNHTRSWRKKSEVAAQKGAKGSGAAAVGGGAVRGGATGKVCRPWNPLWLCCESSIICICTMP